MSVLLTTIKRLYALSGNCCAMPKCESPIILNGVQVGEICHIRARRNKGPRYDPGLTSEERDAYANLILLCRTCHKLVDSDEETYEPELLAEIKSIHEAKGGFEMTTQVAREAELLLPGSEKSNTLSASVKGSGAAVVIGGDNRAPITINQIKGRRQGNSKYPDNAIGADANMAGYVEYLFSLGIDYWKGVEDMNPGRLGNKIKRKFRLKTRTRYHLPIQRFPELVDYIIKEILKPSPAGKRHLRNGTKLCRTFEEWCHGGL